MILTPRLLKIAQMISCRSVADIGTDHAKLPVFLIENNICDYVIASDVADGPVRACKKTVAKSGFEKNIDIRKGDGLEAVSKGEVGAVVLAGMGGDLMSYILEKASDVLSEVREIILQPMTHIPQLRKFLHNNNYFVLDEVLVCEKDKIYTIIKACKGENLYKTEFDYILSPMLINNNDPLLEKHIAKLIKKYSAELKGAQNAANPDEYTINNISAILENLEKVYEITKNH